MRVSVLGFALLLASCATVPRFDHLPALSIDDTPELRLRQLDLMSGSIRGFVVRPGTVSVYVEHLSDHTARTVQTDAADEILAVARNLSQYDQQTLECREVYDGDTVQVEAMLDRRHVSIRADNPWACQFRSEGSRRVNEVLQMLEQAVQ